MSEQPFKIPYVAAVVMHANAHKPQVAAEMLKRTADFCQQHIEAGNWRLVKLILRFLACCSGLYNDEGVFPVLDELFNRAVDLQTASAEDTLGLELVKIILLTIPYALSSSATGLEQKVGELLEKTDIVASTPHALEALVDPYPADGDEEKKPVTCGSLLRVLQSQLQGEAANGWNLACIPRLFKPADVTMDNGDGEDKTPAKHAFPTITIPTIVNPGPKPLFPELYFSLFADQDIESVPPTSNVASSLIRDAIIDTINILDFNRNATAKFLIDLDCYWSEGTFVKRATAFDKLRDIPEGRSTWKPEDVVIDAIFSQVFTLPAPEHKLVYFHSVITESCKIAPAAIAPSLGRAIRFLFRNIDVMDMELSYRYMDWFAHHLSNFEFRWKWTEWIDELDSSNLTPKKAFIIGSLDKEIRLSFAKRIRETLPTQYAPLITEGQVKDAPDLKFLDESTPYAAQGKEVYQLLRKKAPEEDIQKFLDQVEQLAREQGVEDPLVQSTDVYMTCILHIGSKSLSHVLSCIERCKERLLAIGPQSEAGRRQIISSVISYWQFHPGTAVNIIDKLLNYTIITPESVVQWALNDNLQNGRALADAKIYEMVTVTMNKVSNRMGQIVKARNDIVLAGSTPADEPNPLDETLARERQAMRDLFAHILDSVEGVKNASADSMIERFDGESVEQELVQGWGKRWAAVFGRRAAVQEAICGEAAVEAADKLAEEARKRNEEAAAAAAASAAEAAAAAGASANGNGDADADAELMADIAHDAAEV